MGKLQEQALPGNVGSSTTSANIAAYPKPFRVPSDSELKKYKAGQLVPMALVAPPSVKRKKKKLPALVRIEEIIEWKTVKVGDDLWMDKETGVKGRWRMAANQPTFFPIDKDEEPVGLPPHVHAKGLGKKAKKLAKELKKATKDLPKEEPKKEAPKSEPAAAEPPKEPAAPKAKKPTPSGKGEVPLPPKERTKEDEKAAADAAKKKSKEDADKKKSADKEAAAAEKKVAEIQGKIDDIRDAAEKVMKRGGLVTNHRIKKMLKAMDTNDPAAFVAAVDKLSKHAELVMKLKGKKSKKKDEKKPKAAGKPAEKKPDAKKPAETKPASTSEPRKSTVKEPEKGAAKDIIGDIKAKMKKWVQKSKKAA